MLARQSHISSVSETSLSRASCGAKKQYGAVHISRQPLEGGGGVSQMLTVTIADGGADMIFVKMFTLANFGPFMFYPRAHNSLELTKA